MGNTCKPLAVSFKCMTKSTTNKKKRKKKNLIISFRRDIPSVGFFSPSKFLSFFIFFLPPKANLSGNSWKNYNLGYANYCKP